MWQKLVIPKVWQRSGTWEFRALPSALDLLHQSSSRAPRNLGPVSSPSGSDAQLGLKDYKVNGQKLNFGKR